MAQQNFQCPSAMRSCESCLLVSPAFAWTKELHRFCDHVQVVLKHPVNHEWSTLGSGFWEPGLGFETYPQENRQSGRLSGERAPWYWWRGWPKWFQQPGTLRQELCLDQCLVTYRGSVCHYWLCTAFLWQTPLLPLHLQECQPPCKHLDKYHSLDIRQQEHWPGTCLLVLCKSYRPNQGPQHWRGKTSSRSGHAGKVETNMARLHLLR